MVNRRISKMFQIEVESDNDGTITIPADVFIKNRDAIDDIKELLTEESYRVGQPFYFSTVSTSSGIVVTWSKTFKDALPELDKEEDLLGDGLTYIIRKVG